MSWNNSWLLEYEVVRYTSHFIWCFGSDPAGVVGRGDLPVSYRAEFIIDDAENSSSVASNA